MRPDRLARLHSAVDRQAGERIRIVPYTPGGVTIGVSDPARASRELLATVAEVPKVARTSGNSTNSGHNAELLTVSHTVKFATSALPYPLGAGDHVILLEQANRELKVSSAAPFGTDRMLARLEPLPTMVVLS